ncbi:uncharacterized protein LOC116289778 [Actinia tenebrosa]|uniref:Uncharacterized protein LOC116289778 n=1 Tax=Actinia tenebrosa TaxID=6105 RepID=A0A6P8HBS3_ACTTE|nr:uncharacterized protein LOC116289778 [Actinia tenebrosa]
MELKDPKVCFLYDQLRVKTIICLDDYINSGRGTLAELKERLRRTLPEEERRRVRTVKKLVDTLEKQGVIGDNNVEFLKMLAEELELPKLKHKVEEFETKCSGIFQKAVNVAGRAPGFVWQKFKGGVCTSAIYLKTVLSIKGVQVALAGATLIYVYGTNPEKLKDLQPFVEYGTQLVAIFRGSVVFVLKVSSISSLKRLWQSYKDGSLKEKMKKTFNEMKELKEVSHGEEIDVEVTIDEEEYREVLWDLVLLKAKGNSVKTDTKRQRRHSVCCGRDFPEEVSKPMDVTQIQIRVGRPLTELEISIGNIEGLKEALRGKEFTLSRIAEVEEQRLSEIGRQLSEMEIFLGITVTFNQ